jgi:REP element-mobilizing transposase RayT
MARPWRIRYAGAKYHVTVRGNGKQVVFHDTVYYLRFIDQLTDALEKDGVILYAYTLMPNHYHLFIETPHGNIQRFMQRLNTAYSMYHRYKRDEPGHCFQGRYGAKLVSGDDYIIRLTRYIHLNPVKVKKCRDMSLEQKEQYLNDYKWSSYCGYVNKENAEDYVNYEWLKLMPRKTRAGRSAAYRRYLENYLLSVDKDFKSELAVSRYAVGNSEFIKEVEAELLEIRLNKGVYGDIKWPVGKTVSVDEVVIAVASDFKLDKELLLERCYAARQARKIAIELSCRYSNLSQRKIGEYFGYKGNGSVLKQRQKLKLLLNDDTKLSKRLARIKKKLMDD